MGKPGTSDVVSLTGECIAGEGERGEVKHLSTRRRRKQIVIPLVVASERGGWLNRRHVIPGGGCVCGVVGSVFLSPPWKAAVRKRCVSRSGLGWSAVDGESPVGENTLSVVYRYPSSSGPVESAVNPPGPPGKPEYF